MSSGCHAGAYHDSSDYQGAAAFRETMHQQIHLRPTPETVIMEDYFAGDSILRFELGITYAPKPAQDTLLIYLSKSADKKDYFVQMRISNQSDSTEKMKVAYTYGGNGWIQRYLLEVNGNYYIVPFQLVLPGYRKRTTDGGMIWPLDLQYWLVYDTTRSEATFFKPSSNAFRDNSWDKNCSFCHVNGFAMAKSTRGDDVFWDASWVGVTEGDSALQDQNIKIGCESCHGPGSEHVSSPSKTNIIATSTWPMTREGTDLKLALCNQCHNRARSTHNTHRYPYDETNARPYVPGQLLDSFVFSMRGGMNLWPDRVTSYAHHQTGQDYERSAQYRAHLYKDGCWDCHTVHHDKEGLPYQLDRDWYSLEDGVGCMECHGSTGPQQTPKQENLLETTVYNGRVVNAHSMHSAEISQCVNCHMSKTASIGFVELPTRPMYEFTDHSFEVIRPSATRTHMNRFPGMINTCSESCHRNGRGSRNNDPSTPEAPAFGTVDARRAIGEWNNPADVTLADSLWFHYQRMYSKYVVASAETGARPAISLAITSTTPNPFRDRTKISFSVVRRAQTSLEIYDARGRLVRALAGGEHAPGNYSVVWDGTAELGVIIEPGTYFVRLKSGDAIVSKKVVLLR